SSYYTEVYGWDDAIKRDSVISESRAVFPVFAIGKNGGSMMCMLEDNAAVASIEAGVSGKSHSYNYANASYTTLHAVAMEISAKSDKSVMVYESKKPSGVIKQRYRFLDTNQYSNLASSYREYLMDRYPELEKRADEGAPVAVTILGAVDKVKQKLGFPAPVAIPLTTYQEANEIIKDMKETGYRNLNMKYSGWMNGGIKQSAAESIKTISALGDKDDLKKLMDQASEQGVPIYLEGSTGYVYDDGVLDGFKVNRDCAKYASKEIVKLYDFSYIWYGAKDYDDCYYLLKPQKAITYMKNLVNSLEGFHANGVAFTEIGYLLSADYNPKNLITRQEVMEMQQKELKDIASAGTNVMVNCGNDYVLPYVDYITSMDLSGSKYQIIDYSIPFYSMAIHGLVDYSGTSINLSDDYQDMILKSAETGAGLSYTFMKEPTSTLQDSNYTEFYGADYDTWKEEAYRIYSRYEEEMGHCFNQYITDYERIEDGITSTSYEDGTKVYVNYTDQDYTVGNITVLAHDYKVERR
ncbi:MAG TPA: DUF5696 domain-containing protein, partial [Lachnospiraceae bacterium]|nr:DUF5696 domain-containing protein [Lachnospiraceae bacterium]